VKAQLILESRVPLIEPAVEFVKSFGLKAGLTKEEAVELALCADELLTDVVRFAFPEEVGKFVLTLEATPSQVELIGFFGEAITVHTISQRVNAKFGFKSTALMLGTFPEARIVGIREDYGQRISVVIDFLHLIKKEKAEVYLPKEYLKILKEIYQNMGIEVVNKREKRTELPKTSKVELSVNFPMGTAVIVVERSGQDLKERVDRKVKKLFSSGVEVVYADLPLDRAETKRAVKVLRELGFVFSGLVPLFHRERDYLRLQKIKGNYDFKKIELYSEMAKKIAKRVKRELNEVAQER